MPRSTWEASLRLGDSGLHALEAVHELRGLFFAVAGLDELAEDGGSAEVEVFAQVAADFVGARAVDDHLEPAERLLPFFFGVAVLFLGEVRHAELLSQGLPIINGKG